MTTPIKGGAVGERGNDVRIITTFSEHSGDAFAAWELHHDTAVCARCGGAIGGGSDPSRMLGLVVLLVANTVLVAAVAAGIVWLVV